MSLIHSNARYMAKGMHVYWRVHMVHVLWPPDLVLWLTSLWFEPCCGIVSVCRSLNDLLRRHSIARPSVLLIDAESFDCKLVAMTDWCEAPPSLLVFEGRHCKEADLKAAAERLAGRNLSCTAPRWKLVANVEGGDGNLFFTIVPKDFTHTGDRHSSLVAQSSRRSWDT